MDDRKAFNPSTLKLSSDIRQRRQNTTRAKNVVLCWRTLLTATARSVDSATSTPEQLREAWAYASVVVRLRPRVAPCGCGAGYESMVQRTPCDSIKYTFIYDLHAMILLWYASSAWHSSSQIQRPRRRSSPGGGVSHRGVAPLDDVGCLVLRGRDRARGDMVRQRQRGGANTKWAVQATGQAYNCFTGCAARAHDIVHPKRHCLDNGIEVHMCPLPGSAIANPLQCSSRGLTD